MKNLFLALFAVACLVVGSRSITVNPASNVTADSDATANTIVLRDASGNFAANAISPTTVIVSSVQVTGSLNFTALTKAQFDTTAATALWQIKFCTDCTIPGLCKSTGTAAAQWEKIESASAGCGTNN